jgi:hypothetical protein
VGGHEHGARIGNGGVHADVLKEVILLSGM